MNAYATILTDSSFVLRSRFFFQKKFFSKIDKLYNFMYWKPNAFYIVMHILQTQQYGKSTFESSTMLFLVTALRINQIPNLGLIPESSAHNDL